VEPIDLNPLMAAVEESPDDTAVLAASIIQLAYSIGLLQDEINQLRARLDEHEQSDHHA
jgi:uncharacterized small protein (DUF1192 family)